MDHSASVNRYGRVRNFAVVTHLWYIIFIKQYAYKYSVYSVFSAGYIHVKKEISRIIPFKQGSKSGNNPFLFYKMPVANLKLLRGNHFIHHILTYFSYFYLPSYRGRLLQLPEAESTELSGNHPFFLEFGTSQSAPWP